MTEQLALYYGPGGIEPFDPRPRARRTDPDTSHEAAQRAQVFSISHRNRIMAELPPGPGRTPRELAAATGIDYVAVQRRMSELKELGLAEPTTQRRDGCRVWVRAKPK